MPPIVQNATMNTLMALFLENTTKITTNIIPPKNSNFASDAKSVARGAGILSPVRGAVFILIGHSIAEVMSATS